MSNNNNIVESKICDPGAWKTLVDLTNNLEKTVNPLLIKDLNLAIHELVQDHLPQLEKELRSVDREHFDALKWQLSRVENKLVRESDYNTVTSLLNEKREMQATQVFSFKLSSIGPVAGLAWDWVTGYSNAVKNSLSGLIPHYRNSNIFPSDLYRLPEELRQQVLSYLDTETLLDMYHNKSLAAVEFDADQYHWYLRAERWGRLPGDKKISAFDFVKKTISSLKVLRESGLLSVEHSRLSSFRRAEVLASHSSGNLLPLVCPWMKQKAPQDSSINLLPGLTPSVATDLLVKIPKKERDELLMHLAALHGGNPNAREPHCPGPLYQAARWGKLDLLEALILAGANLDHAVWDGVTPLLAAAWAGHFDCVNVLMREGANVHSVAKDGRTVLMAAAWFGKSDCVKALIEDGVDVNSATSEGRTALMYAAHGYVDCVKILLEAGANLRNKNGVSAFSQAGPLDCASLLFRAMWGQITPDSHKHWSFMEEG